MGRLYGPLPCHHPARSTSTTSATRSSSAASSSTTSSSTPVRSPRTTRCWRPLDTPPQRILLTHIHFDHAGATGALVRRWPDVEVWVHERGAPHLIDPSRLTASATRLYGDDMKRLWGEVIAVPEANLRVLTGGETIGPWRVEYTPGHASHHVSYLHEPTGTAFVGDVGGVRVEGGPTIPPTPPPDIDIELWHESLDTVAAWDPARLAITHFGSLRGRRRPDRRDARGPRPVGGAGAGDRCQVLRRGDDRRDGAGARCDGDTGLPAGDAARDVVAGPRSLLDEEERVA